MRRVLILALALAAALAAAPHAVTAQGPARPLSLAALAERARLDSSDALAHYDLGRAYVAAKKFDDGDRELRHSISLAPQFADAYLALSQLPNARGEGYWARRVKQPGGGDSARAVFAEASRFYRRAFLLNPLVDLRLAAEAPRVSGSPIAFLFWWHDHSTNALRAIHDGKYDRAYEEFTKVVQDPRAGNDRANVPGFVLWLRGLVAARLGNYDVAIADISLLTGRAFADEQNEHRANDVLVANDYRYTLATMHYLAGHFDAALATYRRCLEFDLGLYQAHIQMARIFEASKQWPDAVREREAAIAINGDDASLIVDLGATLAAAGRFDEAEATLQQAQAADPHDPRIPYLLATTALQSNHRDLARTSFARFIVIATTRYADQVADARHQLDALQ